ncbi:Flp pilus assembly complex ATPase component TadA [Salipaludibacillus sp. LMS25]|jgi:pilus assembly protein CpaF|uniref:ATPase, T2SS/T4P/T4SS family n=1 Tax=Salipaludibacillus sp. LMS25 TaxID=2924031 RepID=UPI0020D19EE5|nr:ATPase, T2SS/T4P/T4SS family [Salipaludibacillus sp. LMS25]UTR13627.1 Flp pilus assembly complex ATPase component TadA [Salipaludibacillus sp. LMS25]
MALRKRNAVVTRRPKLIPLRPLKADRKIVNDAYVTERQENNVTTGANDAFYGILAPLLEKEDVTDITIFGSDQIYYMKGERPVRSQLTFNNDDELVGYIEKLAIRSGKERDKESPVMEWYLPDGNRAIAILPPFSFKGPVLRIRRNRQRQATLDDLLHGGMIDEGSLHYLQSAISCGKSLLITGEKQVGKTMLLNALATSIPYEEKIVTIEEDAELTLKQSRVVSLGSPFNTRVLEAAFKMAPNRLIVDGGRPADIFEIICQSKDNAVSLLGTVETSSPEEALEKLEAAAAWLYSGWSMQLIRKEIIKAIDLIVHVTQLDEGKAVVSRVTKVADLQGTKIALQDFFKFT